MSSSTLAQWPPQVCEAPDLSGLDSRTSVGFMLNRVFGGGGPTDRRAYAFAMNFIRLVDSLLLEYEEARQSLLRYLTAPRDVFEFSPFVRSTGQFENCISTLMRVVNLLNKLRSSRSGIVVDRKLAICSAKAQAKIRALRNAIEHLDSELSADALGTDQGLCLLVMSDRLQLGAAEILYSELASWISELNTLSREVATFNPES